MVDIKVKFFQQLHRLARVLDISGDKGVIELLLSQYSGDLITAP